MSQRNKITIAFPNEAGNNQAREETNNLNTGETQ